MKKKFKVFVSVALCVVLLFTTATGVAAADGTVKSGALTATADALNNLFNSAVEGLLNVFEKIVPCSYKVGDVETYRSYNTNIGTGPFKDSPAAGAKWKLGYAQSSILPADFSSGVYCKGGYGVNVKLTDVLDDLKVRVIALDDGNGSGTVLFAVVDCLGLANSDVKLIREALSDYARQNHIVSINVSASHCHSSIDTQGIYTNTVSKALKNIMVAFTGLGDLEPAVNENFLNNIIAKTVECAKQATESMVSGKLTYARCNIADYVRDRTPPDISIDELYRFKFTPDNGGKGTIIANFGAHPESIGYEFDVASSDFIYYAEQVINDAGYNFMFIQGAVGTITEDLTLPSDGIAKDRIEGVQRYGQEIAYILLGMTLTEQQCKDTIVDYDRENLAKDSPDYTPWYEGHQPVEEKVLDPILNIRQKEFIVRINNNLYGLMGKIGLSDNLILKDKDNKLYTVTEVGIMELGKDVTVILSPGETYAELIKGGEDMEDFGYDCAYDVMSGKDVLVFDLMNDAVGYIMPDGFFTYATVREKNGGIDVDSSWGLTSLGRHAATNIYGQIYKLYDSLR